jgi:hypothetical protein
MTDSIWNCHYCGVHNIDYTHTCEQKERAMTQDPWEQMADELDRLRYEKAELLKACQAGLESLVAVLQSEFETTRTRHPEDHDPAVGQMREAIALAEGERTVTP